MFGVLWLALAALHPGSGAQSRAPDLPLQYTVPLADVATLELVLEKGSYHVAEPFKLTLAVRNVSDGDIWCHCVPMYQAEVTYRLKGKEFRPLQLTDWDLEMFPTYRLKPGEAVSDTAVVAYDLGKKAPPFDRPGVYEVRALYFDYASSKPRSKLQSTTVLIAVHPPTDSDAYEAYSSSLSQLAQFGRESERRGLGVETIEEAAAYLRRFGRSEYAPALRDGLVALLRNRIRRDDATERDREIYQEVQRASREDVQKPRP